MNKCFNPHQTYVYNIYGQIITTDFLEIMQSPWLISYYTSISFYWFKQTRLIIQIFFLIYCCIIYLFSDSTLRCRQRVTVMCKLILWHWPVQLAPIERLGLEGDGCTVARLGAVDINLSTQLYPRYGQDRAGISRWQSERVLLPMLQQVQITWGETQLKKTTY